MPVPTRDKNVPRRVHHYNAVVHAYTSVVAFFSFSQSREILTCGLEGFLGPYLAIQTCRIISWLDGTPKKEKKAGEESIPLLRNSYMQECSGRQGKKERERERERGGILRENQVGSF